MAKLSTISAFGEEAPFSYGNKFYRQPLSIGSRLTIGPAEGHVDILLSLAATWRSEQYFVLYVLLVSHSGVEPGRYESPTIDSLGELEAFFRKHKEFLESDGRHHVWIVSAENEGTLVYDQHNVVFGYGDLEHYQKVLREKKFQEEAFSFPSPHTHSFPPAHAQDEANLLAHYPWIFSPLKAGDEYA